MRHFFGTFLAILTVIGVTGTASGQVSRINSGLQVLYGFQEESGQTVHDLSGVGTPLDLTIDSLAGVSWLPVHGLRIDSSTVINSLVPATKLYDAHQVTQAITIEVWIEPSNTTQTGPARIAAFSENGGPNGGNFMLGQTLDDLEMRLRSTDTDQYGNPPLIAGPGSAGTEMVHVAFTRNALGITKFYMNGTEVANGATGGSLDNWGMDYTFTLGNEPQGNRPWLGTFYLLAVFDRALDQVEIGQNFAFGPVLCFRPPSITSSPVTTGTVGVEYVYDVDALGCPEPEFTLPLGPPGMNIDQYTGLVTWTPTSAGTYSVSAEAVNRYGEEVQDYEIMVSDPVPCGPWYVAGDGEDAPGRGSIELPFATLQYAINAASAGEEVIALPDTFRGDGNRDIDFLGKAITVRSLNNDPAECVIDCEGTPAEPHRGFHFKSNETPLSVLQYVTITGGDGFEYGGGILIGSTAGGVTSSPTLTGCILSGNSATNGAGIAVMDVYGEPVIEGCSIFENIGSGFHSSWASGVDMVNCDVSLNSGSGVVVAGDEGGNLYDPAFTDCTIGVNDIHGMEFYPATGFYYPTITDCALLGNDGWGIFSEAYSNDWAGEISGGSVTGNGLGGINITGGTLSPISNVLVELNIGPGLLLDYADMWDVAQCQVLDNRGHGISFDFDFTKRPEPSLEKVGTPHVYECDIGLNDGRGIDYQLDFFNEVSVVDCLIFNNGLEGIGIDAILHPSTDGQLTVSGCTIDGNGVAGISHSTGLPWSIGYSIISNNLGPAVLCTGTEIPQVTCSNIWGNENEENWTGCLEGLLVPFNISLDPGFCGTDNPDDPYTLRDDSPCAAENNPDCGRIGARGLGGCSTVNPSPTIASIIDVGNDQGRNVRIVWNRSDYDQPGSPVTITDYGIYRRQDEYKSKISDNSSGDKLAGWDFLLEVHARGDTAYQAVVPTLCDSTKLHGDCWSFFMVSAVTPDPFVYFDSEVDSGYSVDNLIPGAPNNITADYFHSENTLKWDPSTDPDFLRFRIFRVPRGGGPPAPYSAHHDSTTITSWKDSDWGSNGDAWDFAYYLAAVDSSGNESVLDYDKDPSAVESGVPSSFMLHQNVPNPFNPMTTISFDLPHPGRARLCIFDISGRVVKELIADDALDAGRHQEIWNGDDAKGQTVAAGVYFYHLDAGSSSQTRRMVLLK